MVTSTLDIGGGCVKNDEYHSLARLLLRWMIQECFRTRFGILFATYCLEEVAMKGNLAHWMGPPKLAVEKWNEDRENRELCKRRTSTISHSSSGCLAAVLIAIHSSSSQYQF
jgi:hypothetical protein